MPFSNTVPTLSRNKRYSGRKNIVLIFFNFSKGCLENRVAFELHAVLHENKCLITHIC